MTETLQEKIDAIFADPTQLDYAHDNVNQAIEELREAISNLPTHVGDTSAGVDMDDVLALIGEKKE